MTKADNNQFGYLRKFLAWCVHFYTALGLVVAAGIAVLIVNGGTDSFRWAFVLMLVATFIDGTDGTLARAVRVKEVVPGFDGRRLDDITDFLTYTFLPLLLLWRAHVLPAGYDWCLVVALLASAYGFCQVSIKTDDGYFLGFPSYWNLVALYLYLLSPAGWVSVSLILLLSLLTFVPTRYLYPSQGGTLNLVTCALGVVWGAMLLWILTHLPSSNMSLNQSDSSIYRLTLWSLFFPVHYTVASWVVTVKIWQTQRHQVTGEPRAS